MIQYLNEIGCSLADNITLAEDFKDWTNEATYQNLMDFEDDIAHFSSLIVIVLESPGALTELGLFAANNLINKKTFVIVNSEHHKQDSFIRLGPLKYLESHKEGSVASYSWNENGPVLIEKESLGNLRSDILNSLRDLDKTELFNRKNIGHLALFIYQIVYIYKALKFKEIELYVKHFWNDVSHGTLKRLLFLLKKFQFIEDEKRGRDVYYYVLKTHSRINFGGTFDLSAAQMSAMQYYTMTDSESNRSALIKSKFAATSTQANNENS